MFPMIGNGTPWFFQALEDFTKIFPSLGKPRAEFSKAWKHGL
jgi:hypothetical protein